MSRKQRESKYLISAFKLALCIVFFVLSFGIIYVQAASTSNPNPPHVSKIKENRSSMPLVRKPDLQSELKANAPMEIAMDPEELAHQETFNVSAKCDSMPIDHPSAPFGEDTRQEILQIQNDPFFN
ncbi:MAG: hypothetical protein ACOY3I_09675 [Verrucomicrobiota bacterium]